MLSPGPAAMLRVYLGDADRVGGKPAFRAIVELLRTNGVAGCTVLHGIEGFGSKQHLHTDRLLSLSNDLPVVIEAIDRRERLETLLPQVGELVGDGLVALIDAEVVIHRSGDGDAVR